MYNAGYSFGNPAFNQPGTPQQQQQPQQPPQQPGQPNPQMMYNQQQQFAGMGPQGGFNPGANPQMMQGMQAGMMQNPGMANMPPNGQMPGYPQQFPGAGYGQMMPGGGMPQNFAPNNYMMAGGMQGFPMNQQGMNPQQLQMMQRMQAQQAAQQAAQQQQQQHQQQHQPQQHPQQQQQLQQQQQHPQQGQQPQQPQQQQQQQQPPPQQQQQQQPQPPQQHPQQQQQQHHQQQMNAGMNQVSTPQRPPSAAQGTPTNTMQLQQQPQFSTPQPQSQNQTPHNAQPQSASGTPQTPTFSANHGSGMSLPTSATPLSPGTESREKERFALLLDINHELLYESIQIQTTQQELKKENPSPSGNPAERKPTDEENLFQQDYLHCMRRLQGNLSYMAALADRKPEVKVPPCPAYLSAPPLNLSLKLRAAPIGAEAQDTNIDPLTDRAERDKTIKDLYRQLQAAFPGFDPKKEPAFRQPGPGQKAGGQGPNQASPTVLQNPQMPNMTAPPGNPGMLG